MSTPRLSKSEYIRTIKVVEECIAEGCALGGQPSATAAAARRLGMSHGTVHSRLVQAQTYFGLAPRADIKRKDQPKPKRIIAWDIETLPMLVATWGTYKQRINSDQIIEQTAIACASWQDIGKDKITSVSLLDDPKRFQRDPYDDSTVVKSIHAMLMDVASRGDVLLHQNGDQFDLPKVKARIIFHKLAPIPPIQCIDTLKGSRKAGRFDSHRLDFYDKRVVGAEGKIDTRGMDMWVEACAPKAPHSVRVKAMKEMVRYNRGDLPPLIRKYQSLFAYMSGPNRAIGVGECCPRCGNKTRQHIGYHDKATRRYPVYRCDGCTGVYEGTQSIARAWFKAA